MSSPEQVILTEFQVHLLNEKGIRHARELANNFSTLLAFIEKLVPDPASPDRAIAKQKLQEACFFAKRAMAERPENQKVEPSALTGERASHRYVPDSASERCAQCDLPRERHPA